MAVTVVTLNTSLVRGITAKFNGELIDMNGQAAIDCYFQYRITGASSWSDTSANKEELTAVGQFSYEISGLTENEFYDVRAVAEWTDGTLQNAYGDTETFNASWVREGSREDFSRGIINDVGPYPIFHDADTKSICSSDTTSITVDRPSNVQPGDLILLFFVADMNTYSSGPGDGFTLIRSEGGATCMAWYKIATVGESASYTIQTGTSHKCLVAVRVTNVDIHNNPIDQNNGRNSGGSAPNSWEIYGITPTRKYSMLFHAVGIRTSSRSITSPAGTGIQEIFNVTSGAGCIERWQDMMATGSRTYTFSGTTRVGGLIFNVNGLDKLSLRYLDIGVGTRQKPYKITNTSSEITWTATTPTDTTLAIEAQVQGTTAITDEAVGTGDGTTKVFYLDHWPADTPAIKVDGVAETGFTLGNDRRTITFDTAPAGTHVILASYTAVDDPQEDDPEIQELDLDDPAGGTFKLGDGTDWTADIAYDASAATIETALEGLYGAGDVTVLPDVLEAFTAVGTTSWTVPADVNTVDVLVVAGGGGGGYRAGGGGGAGGVLFSQSVSVTPSDTIDISVGDGGSGATSSNYAGSDGSDSSFGSGGSQLLAKGGGGGGSWHSGSQNVGRDGGSGGGGGYNQTNNKGYALTLDPMQGNDGGDGRDGSHDNRRGGGGGGADSAGLDGGDGAGGEGGNPKTILGYTVGRGGQGGERLAAGTGANGDANTGDGGDGGGDEYAGGNGGSGIVIIALPKFLITFDPSVGNSGLVADFTGLT